MSDKAICGGQEEDSILDTGWKMIKCLKFYPFGSKTGWMSHWGILNLLTGVKI